MDQEIKKELLKKCAIIFNEISSEPDSFYGTPPSVYYIDFGYGEKRMIGLYMPNPHETYKYEKGVMVKVETGLGNKTEPISGMYYHEGHASIGIDKMNQKAFLSFSVGPRYGRAYQYEIIYDEEGNRLGEEKPLWVS
ncbi:MAG: hypothetical protein IJU99_02440 [Lachnospiraceae bacterium]|nr:hypothetical protein [Lachnospiraceae bacterium]MBR0152327.1 hypothetical protein [Lachnospiraceae bacterium]